MDQILFRCTRCNEEFQGEVSITDRASVMAIVKDLTRDHIDNTQHNYFAFSNAKECYLIEINTRYMLGCLITLR